MFEDLGINSDGQDDIRDLSSGGRHGDSQGGPLIVPSTAMGIEKYRNKIPGEFSLIQNYPNPFNATTTVPYEIPYPMEIEMSLYDVQGKHIAVLFKGKQSAGIHRIDINGDQLASGIYYYIFKTRDYHDVRKCILIK
jgi:hypothetical protein